MIVMLDTSHRLDRCALELGLPVEQLLTPLTRFKLQNPDAQFAIDNGAYAGFCEADFRSLLAREWPRRAQCRFVVAPDVVGNAAETRELFEQWRFELQDWRVAFVCQDGQTPFDLPMNTIKALFIGGSTAWKLSAAAAACVHAAKSVGKWVHAGRVNTPKRFAHFRCLGVDSIDGSGLGRFSWMRTDIRNLVCNGKLTYSRYKVV